MRKGSVFVRINNHIIILVTLIVSASYIFGLDYYDKREAKIEELYKRIELPEITYTHITTEFKAIKEEILDEKQLAAKENEVLQQFSHTYDCSRLCTQIHEYGAAQEFIQAEDKLGTVIQSRDQETPYIVTIAAQKDIGYNTRYHIKIEGLSDLKRLDHLRNLSLGLFDKWRMKPKETIYFIGDIDKKLIAQERKAYADKLLKALKGHHVSYYKDDYSEDAEAYYGYTKAIKEHILDEQGKKSNTQISFSYNETRGVTQIIAAFPFYNEPF